ESVPQAWSNRCRVGETHHRKALAGLKIGGFHPPYNIDFPTLPGQTLKAITSAGPFSEELRLFHDCGHLTKDRHGGPDQGSQGVALG
ncbi:MAG TPA: hypothetical protein VFF52_01395, partial [Isosphaeraceae bacterium]|nr:hypothetical protein [Isosphaeraceae bacterium]